MLATVTSRVTRKNPFLTPKGLRLSGETLVLQLERQVTFLVMTELTNDHDE